MGPKAVSRVNFEVVVFSAPEKGFSIDIICMVVCSCLMFDILPPVPFYKLICMLGCNISGSSISSNPRFFPMA